MEEELILVTFYFKSNCRTRKLLVSLNINLDFFRLLGIFASLMTR
jgi:hypothetical protein